MHINIYFLSKLSLIWNWYQNQPCWKILPFLSNLKILLHRLVKEDIIPTEVLLQLPVSIFVEIRYFQTHIPFFIYIYRYYYILLVYILVTGCNQVVNWLIYEQPINISEKQVCWNETTFGHFLITAYDHYFVICLNTFHMKILCHDYNVFSNQ